MLDKNGVEIKVGDKFVGFAFSDKDYPIVGYVKSMNNNIGKVLTVTSINNYNDSVCGNPDDDEAEWGWAYPAELIEIITSEVDNSKKSDTIKTSKRQAPKRICWAVYTQEGIHFGSRPTREQARALNRSLGGGLQIHKMETVAKSN